MSRIGKKPIVLPQGVKVVFDQERVVVEGPKGKLSEPIPSGVNLEIQGGKVFVTRKDEARQTRANQGLIRSLINNMVQGVHHEFQRGLEISGVGYRAELSGNKLIMQLGYSHKIEWVIPDGVKVTVEKQTKILVRGIDRHAVGQVAAKIRAFKKPDPYKGKGVLYEGEKLKKKAGKKAV